MLNKQTLLLNIILATSSTNIAAMLTQYNPSLTTKNLARTCDYIKQQIVAKTYLINREQKYNLRLNDEWTRLIKKSYGKDTRYAFVIHDNVYGSHRHYNAYNPTILDRIQKLLYAITNEKPQFAKEVDLRYTVQRLEIFEEMDKSNKEKINMTNEINALFQEYAYLSAQIKNQAQKTAE